MQEKMRPQPMHGLFAILCVWFMPTANSASTTARHRFALFALRLDNVNLFADWKLKSRA